MLKRALPPTSRLLSIPARALSIALALLLLASIHACSEIVGPPGAQRFDPPDVYRVHWRTIESCSGLSGNFDDVAWYSTPGSASLDVNAVGAWYPSGNRIYLNRDYVDDPQVVRHEMLHALNRVEEGHPAEFLIGCGGLVTCTSQCELEAGGPIANPTNSSPVISPSELALDATVIAPQPSDAGWTALIVRATNPYPYAVWVDLSGRTGFQFGCLIMGSQCGPEFYYGGADVKGAFGPNETRQEALLFEVLPGRYTVQGRYNSVNTAPLELVVP